MVKQAKVNQVEVKQLKVKHVKVKAGEGKADKSKTDKGKAGEGKAGERITITNGAQVVGRQSSGVPSLRCSRPWGLMTSPSPSPLFTIILRHHIPSLVFPLCRNIFFFFFFFIQSVCLCVCLGLPFARFLTFFLPYLTSPPSASPRLPLKSGALMAPSQLCPIITAPVNHGHHSP